MDFDDLQQSRIAAVHISNQYAEDVESLFNLAKVIELFFVTGMIPSFDDDGDGSEVDEPVEEENVVPIKARGTKH